MLYILYDRRVDKRISAQMNTVKRCVEVNGEADDIL